MIIGLTGGIASGKSSVASMMRELGLPVIDADIAARKVVEPGEEAYTEIIKHFGKDIVQGEDQSINRQKLGSIIFHDEQERKALNAIVHPAVRSYMNAKKQRYIEDGFETIVMDIPLLFESKLTDMVDKTLLVYTDLDIQLKRLMARNQLSEQEAQARIHAQMPLIDKVSLADAVINNNETLQKTETQLIEVLTTWKVNLQLPEL